MKVAFITDMHFGYPRFEKDAFEQGKEAILSAAGKADVIILGGDNFDAPVPKMETLAEVVSILREAIGIFKKRGIAEKQILAIHGNHDRRAKGFVHPTELLAQGGFLESIHNRTVVIERNGEKAAISGMGNVPDDMAADALKSLSCKPVDGMFNIFVLHQSFQEFGSPNPEHLTYDDLPEGYDLYLCGHIHRPCLKGKVLNPGSTVVTQLREDEVGQRGWLLYDTQERKAEFQPVKSRALIHKTLSFDAGLPSQITSEVEKQVKAIMAQQMGAGAPPLVKIALRGTLKQGFRPSDLKFPEFGPNIFIDNAISAESLRERISQIKQSREKKLSSKDVGMQILRKNLQGTAYNLGDPEKLFESLLEGTALQQIKEKIEKS